MSDLTKVDFKLAFLAAVLFTEDKAIDLAVAHVAGHVAMADQAEKKVHFENMKNILEDTRKQLDETMVRLEAKLNAEVAGRTG